jgi:hypothetical protein
MSEFSIFVCGLKPNRERNPLWPFSPSLAGQSFTGQSNLAGLQTPELVSFIDVSLFGANRGPAPGISPDLISVVQNEQDRSVVELPFLFAYFSCHFIPHVHCSNFDLALELPAAALRSEQ